MSAWERSKGSARQARRDGIGWPLPEGRLAGGEWFVEKRLPVADLKCFLWVRWLKSGALDHIPADIVEQQAPLLAKHFERVRDYPRIAAYYAARGK